MHARLIFKDSLIDRFGKSAWKQKQHSSAALKPAIGRMDAMDVVSQERVRLLSSKKCLQLSQLVCLDQACYGCYGWSSPPATLSKLISCVQVGPQWSPCKTPSKLPLHSAENLHHKASAKAGLRALVTSLESQDECALMPSWQSWVFFGPWAGSMDFGVSNNVYMSVGIFFLTNKYGASKECPHPPSTFASHGLKIGHKLGGITLVTITS